MKLRQSSKGMFNYKQTSSKTSENFPLLLLETFRYLYHPHVYTDDFALRVKTYCMCSLSSVFNINLTRICKLLLFNDFL